jgi:hypothetical protein
VERLRDDGELLLAEDAVGTHDAVQCAKAGVVAVDAVGGHSFGNKRRLHLGRLVVAEV